MGIILILLILTVVCFIVALMVNDKKSEVFGTLSVLIGTLTLILFLFGYFSGCSFRKNDLHWEEMKRTEIYSLENKSDTKGIFIICFGYEKSEMYYYYYVKGENGGYIINKINAKGVEIVEKDITNGYIVTYSEAFTSFNFFFEINKYTSNTKQVIYVPIGTITYEYNIN